MKPNKQNKKHSSQSYDSRVPDDQLADHLKRWRARLSYFSIFSALPAMLAGVPQAAVADDKTQEIRPTERQANFPGRPRPVKPEFLRKTGDYRLPYEKGRPEIFPSLTGSDDCPGTPIPAGNYTAPAPYTDTGDTTGANNTVGVVAPYYYYSSGGPDRVYSFVVTSIGENPEITVTTTSPTYRPMIYVSAQCPSGVGNTITEYSMPVSNSRWTTGNTASLGSWTWNSSLFLGKKYYLYIDSSEVNDAGPYTLKIQDVKVVSSPAVIRKTRPDFDGDGLLDFSIFRPSDGTWWIKNSSSSTSSVRFGLGTDKPVPEDYDGDARTDIAVFRDGDWWILRSSDAVPFAIHWGQPGDIPVPGDYNGDGRPEIAIFRNGEWWTYDLVSGQYSVSHFGLPGDKPIPGDYDGDGKTDQAVYRNGTWHLNRSLRGYAVVQWGLATDKPVPAYYDWDNTMDLAVFRNGVWYILWSTEPNNPTIWNLGAAGDVPVPGGYYGPYSGQPTIYRSGVWFLSFVYPFGWSDQFDVVNFGQAGDIPLPGNTP